MRVLIFSDIHANEPALDAVLAAAGDCAMRLCLGDVVGYGADPNPACDKVRAHAALVVRGNHDRAAAGLSNLERFNPKAAISARWTRSRLRPENHEWLLQLPPGPCAWQEMGLVHGSPLDEDEYLTGLDQAAACFSATSARLQWFGHTHVQGGFEANGRTTHRLFGPHAQPGPPPGSDSAHATLPLRPDRRYLLNPGSVGQPRDGDPRPAFAVYDTDADSVEFHRLAYDVAEAQRRILAAGLPAFLASRLSSGR